MLRDLFVTQEMIEADKDTKLLAYKVKDTNKTCDDAMMMITI